MPKQSFRSGSLLKDLAFEVERLETRQLLSCQVAIEGLAGFAFAEVSVGPSEYSQVGTENTPSEYGSTLASHPQIGAVVTAFSGFDPEDTGDPWDILTNWKGAIDELHALGVREVTFAVYRQVTNGNLSGGPAIETVQSAIAHARQKGLTITMLPLFEVFDANADGWRGAYDPSGARRTRFRAQYTQLISDLASIRGIDRFNIGSELNAMVDNPNNDAFFSNLVAAAQAGFVTAGNTTGRIGYAANFDAYANGRHATIWNHTGIDFMGISAYFSVVDPIDGALVSGTGPVSNAVLEQMVSRWQTELDQLTAVADSHGLSVVIQEFGAVQENYASVAPFAVNPSDFVGDGAPGAYAIDPDEQAALYASLLTALDDRADDFESVHFWSWEHGADRGERHYSNVDPSEPRYINRFAIWPTDGGGGEVLAQFLANQTSSNTAPEILGITGPTVLLNGRGGTFSASASDANNDVLSYRLEVVGPPGATVETGTTDELVFVPQEVGTYTLEVYVDDGMATTYQAFPFEVGHLVVQSDHLLIAGTPSSDRVFVLPGTGPNPENKLRVRINRDLFAVNHDGPVTIYGLGGNDLVRISGSPRLHRDIRVYGEAGDDLLVGGRGDDLLNGGPGADRLLGGRGNDQLLGGIGWDRLIGGVGSDWLDAGSDVEADRLVGGIGANTFLVWAGDLFKAGDDDVVLIQ